MEWSAETIEQSHLSEIHETVIAKTQPSYNIQLMKHLNDYYVG